VDENTGRTWPDSLSDEDLAKLRPLLFLELSAMFDSAGIPFHKGKPHKRKRREGSYFNIECKLIKLGFVLITSLC
jgi:hypothetical protein